MEKIDFVLTWVDGNDPEWQAEKSKYQDTKTGYDSEDNRYRDWDTLRYWFRAVEAYAPWVNKIHFVTCGQTPEWLNTDHPKLHLVNHRDYIPEEFLPTYSSHTIELNFHRIKELEEQFVYFNDDTFLNRPVKPTDFFKNGLPLDVMALDCIYVSRGTAGFYNAANMEIINSHFWAKDCFRKNKRKWLSPKYGIRNLYKTITLLYKNWFPGIYYTHLPTNFLKSTYEKVWELEADVLRETCACKFREKTNVNQWLMKYWQLASGNFEPQKRSFGKCFHISNTTVPAVDALKKSKYGMICINDTSLTQDFERAAEEVRMAFEEKLPNKSQFEK